MKVPFIDLKFQYNIIKEKMQHRINTVLDHGQFVMGPEIAELEGKLSEFVGGAHTISCSSGTSGLYLALKALGVGHGDEVITTAFSFFATADSIIGVGAKPVFVDIDPETYNINPNLIESHITKHTKAIIPVSIYGQISEIEKINAVAQKHQLPVIEDAAQSFGAKYKGKMSCTVSDIGVTSFFPAKPLGCYGDGGAVFTKNKDLAEKMKQLRVHGQDTRYHHISIGTNARMDTLQAAILLVKLERYTWEIEQRQKIASKYTAAFMNSGGKITPPRVLPEHQSVWAQYTIRVKNRDEFQKRMTELQVPTAVHYPIPMSEQPAVKAYLNGVANTPVASLAAKEVISLPMFPDMTDDQQNFIIDCTLKAVK